MIDHPLHYHVADPAALDEVVSALASQFNVSSEPEKTIHSTYYDSFDWRLYQADALLHEEQGGGQHQLVWQSLSSEATRETVRLSGPVAPFCWDYAPGLLHEMLQKNLEMRALIPQVEVSSRVRLLRVLDAEEKTVLRLEVEVNSARNPGHGEYCPMSTSLRLVPVRGYLKPLAKVQHFLRDGLKLKQDGPNRLEVALACIERRPLDYSSKLNFVLDGTLRSDAVARQIHLHLLHTMEANIPGTRSDIDSEFLHDLRVAVRRTRSALTQVKDVFPQEEVEKYKERFAWMGSITGETRDMDVYLLGYAGFRDSLPEQFRADLNPLHEFLLAHQKTAHKTMMRKLNSPHFRRTLKEWRAFLESPVPENPEAANAATPISQVARKRISRIFERVLQDGLAIRPNSPAEALHDLRKDCKKLRYLLEFFQSVYGKEQVLPLIKTLKVLLNNLGDFQDLEVQAYKLRVFAHQMVEEGEVPADTLLAMGMLVDGLLKSQQQSREQFAERFAQFAEEKNCATYRQLFGSKRKKSKKRLPEGAQA